MIGVNLGCLLQNFFLLFSFVEKQVIFAFLDVQHLHNSCDNAKTKLQPYREIRFISKKKKLMRFSQKFQTISLQSYKKVLG